MSEEENPVPQETDESPVDDLSTASPKEESSTEAAAVTGIENDPLTSQESEAEPQAVSNEAATEAPANDEPVKEEPVKEEPVDEAPANEAPANKAPANESPANTPDSEPSATEASGTASASGAVPPPPSKLDRVRAEYDKLFRTGDYTAVYTKALAGGLRYSKLRALCWKLFLRVLPPEVDKWEESLSASRKTYADLHTKYYVDPYKDTGHLDPTIHNPLSTSEESNWGTYHENTELEKLIKQDLGRTYPEYEFFQSDEVQTTMLHVLFIYARENPELSYRQGMHELLAPMLYVMDREKMVFDGSNKSKISSEEAKSPSDAVDLTYVLDQDYMEADAYELFCRVMSVMKPFFLPSRPQRPVRQAADPLGLSSLTGTSSPKNAVEGEQSAVVKKCHRIHHVLLRKFDSQLYNYLERLKIEPQLYCLRWVRLLLSREFHLEDVLVLWDAIYAESNDFGLVDYVIVAMLVYIREDILGKDYSMAMRRLFKYPPVEDVHMFVEEGLSMRNPSKTFALKTSSGASLNSPGSAGSTTKQSDNSGKGAQSPPVFELPSIRPIKVFVKQKSSLIGHQSTMLLKEAITNLEADIGELKNTQLQMGQRMENIVDVLQAELMEGSEDYNQNNVLMALAELKQIRDILNDAI